MFIVKYGIGTIVCSLVLLVLGTGRGSGGVSGSEKYGRDTMVGYAVSADSASNKGIFRKIENYFEDSNEDKTFTKRFDFSVIGGPHYSSDVKVGLGMVAAGLYRVDRTDSITPPSNVSLYGDITTSGFYLVGIRGNTFFEHAKYRIDYRLYFYSFPSKFWGIGYGIASNNDNESEYKRLQTSVKIDLMYELGNRLYVGVNGHFNYTLGKDFDRPDYLNGQKNSYTDIGAGLLMMYDSRDYITEPHKGCFFKMEDIYYPDFMGNESNFNSMELTLDYYHRLWKGAIMAYDLHGKYLSGGDVPWTMLALMGGSFRMRGYYEGRYRDNGLVEVQAELRQKVWRRIGCTVWGGAGNIFHTFSGFDFSETLPNAGVGLRWEFKSRVNVRLDYGIGKGETGFIFNINEAF